MSKKVAAVIVGTTGAVLAGVLGYATYLNKRYDLDLEHLHDEDDYDDDEDFLFEPEEDGADLSECEEEDEFADFNSDEPHKDKDKFMSTDPFATGAPEGFGFAPHKGSMADGMFAGDAFGCTPNFTAPVVPMSKESCELWQKFLQSRANDAQKHMNTGKVK